MKKRNVNLFVALGLSLVLAASALSVVPALPAAAASSAETQDMYRLFDPATGEHLYTADLREKNHLSAIGWNYEGIGWVAPKKSNTPVYRLFHPVSGDHHYTMSAHERDVCVKQGWRYEGIGWYSDDEERVPLYRQYKPTPLKGAHNYTTSKHENDVLTTRQGWSYEGIGWYAVEAGKPVANTSNNNTSSASNSSSSTANNSSSSTKPVTLTEQEVYARIMSLQNQEGYTEGTPWTNSNVYVNRCPRQAEGYMFPAGTVTGGGCYGFAMKVQEYAMNYQYPVYHTDASYNSIPKIHVGDSLRVDNDGHSVLVLSVAADGHTVTVVEGNFNSSVHWGRTIDLSDPSEGLIYVESFWR